MKKTLIPLAAVSVLSAPLLAQQPANLVVYTYDSFVSEWGPGPALIAGFQARCGCTLELVGAGDAAELLARLRLEGARTRADVVLGLDTNLMAAAAQTGLFAPHEVDDSALTLPIDWADDTFLPFDWGYFAFVHDTRILPRPPASLAELAASDISVIIQDPRSSTPGLGLVLWVAAVHGDQAADIWAGLADNIVTVTPGWSEAYGLFLEGESQMVLSYTTSPAYHAIAEGDPNFAAARFAEGHLMQIEVAAMLAGSTQPELAQDFLAYLIAPEFQAVIPTSNWMYPAALPDSALPEGFGTPGAAGDALFLDPQQAEALRGPATDAWLAALSR
jgi:thiamine transport system substrate-binding protein